MPVACWLARLAPAYGWDLSMCSAHKTASGQPSLRVAGRWVFCSVAHASGITAVAVHPTLSIGIDVEPIDTRRTDADLLQHYFPDAASPRSESGGPGNDRFLIQWTAAEAWLKAHGRGIADLEAAVHALRSGACRLTTWREKHNDRSWRLSQVIIAEKKDAVG